mgnify:CR=1 FL=1
MRTVRANRRMRFQRTHIVAVTVKAPFFCNFSLEQQRKVEKKLKFKNCLHND